MKPCGCWQRTPRTPVTLAGRLPSHPPGQQDPQVPQACWGAASRRSRAGCPGHSLQRTGKGGKVDGGPVLNALFINGHQARWGTDPTGATAGMLTEMAQDFGINSVRLTPSHPFTNILLCKPEKCQRRMGEMRIFKNAVPPPKGFQKLRALLPIFATLSWTES